MKLITELIAIKEKAQAYWSDKSSGMSDFHTYWVMEEPLREWATEQMKRACAKRGLIDYSMLERYLCDIDQQYMSKPRAEVEPLHILLDDGTVRVSAWIDYDLDTTLAKFSVQHLATGLKHRDCFDLEARYGRILV